MFTFLSTQCALSPISWKNEGQPIETIFARRDGSLMQFSNILQHSLYGHQTSTLIYCLVAYTAIFRELNSRYCVVSRAVATLKRSPSKYVTRYKSPIWPSSISDTKRYATRYFVNSWFVELIIYMYFKQRAKRYA